MINGLITCSTVKYVSTTQLLEFKFEIFSPRQASTAWRAPLRTHIVLLCRRQQTKIKISLDMGKSKKRSRSRSRSRSQDRPRSRRRMQEQLDMLAKSVHELIKQQASQNALINSNQHNKDISSNKENTPANKAQEVIPAKKNEVPATEADNEVQKSPEVITEETQNQVEKVTDSMEEGQLDDENYELDDELREVLGEEIPVTKAPVKINDNLKKWWQDWMSKGLTEEARKSLLKKQPKNEDFRSEAPKVNLEVQRHLTDIAKKRDDHFAETQSCVGAAILLLSSAVSLLSDNSSESIDQISLVKSLWDTGKILCDVFHQQSVARKSFITPTLDKDIKPTLEASVPDEWLYGEKLNEKVKDAKAIVKAASTLKTAEKPAAKKQAPRNLSQGNFRGPPARFRQVGTYQRRFVTNPKYRQRHTATAGTSKTAQKTITEKSAKTQVKKMLDSVELGSRYRIRFIAQLIGVLIACIPGVEYGRAYSKRWLVFAQENKIDAFEPASTEVISFLTSRFNEGAKYGTLNLSRAAISLISKNSLSNDPLLSRFIRGTYKIRPARPKYSETWDTDIVLTYIEKMTDLDKLKLKELTEITATLLILITAHRLQTLALIKTENIIESTVGLKIKIPDLIKTSRPGEKQPILSIPFFKDRRNICPIHRNR
ncbi:Protein of unknown function [Cotesia congregata]|uniref:Tyr recombinase domain-containing protein n=1 Tax=Cotesia congregata TaxID=51543 RepID=A0A8J2HQA0_COTCN|nr:Protein of unknown function [Cotesia congregata]